MTLFILENRGDVKEVLAQSFLRACRLVGFDPQTTYLIKALPPCSEIHPAMGDFIEAA